MRAHTGVDFDDIDRVEGKGIAVAKKIAAISPAVHGIHDDGRVQKIDGVTPPLVKYCTLRAKEGPPQGPALGPFSGNAVFLPLTLLRQAERSVNTWRLHAGNSSASQFVSTPGRLAHAPAQLSILVVLLSCDVYPQVDRASMCCGRVVRRNHAEPCLRAVVRGHRHALLPLRNCRHFVDSRWNRALPTSFVAILPSSPSSRSAHSIAPSVRGPSEDGFHSCLFALGITCVERAPSV